MGFMLELLVVMWILILATVGMILHMFKDYLFPHRPKPVLCSECIYAIEGGYCSNTKSEYCGWTTSKLKASGNWCSKGCRKETSKV